MNETHPTAEQILGAARAAFAELGYDATSITEIAGRVGVVEATIYRHFPSKRALLHEVIRGFYEPLIASAAAGVAGISDPRDRLRHLVGRHLRAMTEDRLLCRLVIAEARTMDDYFESEVLRKRPYLKREWCIRVVQQPIKKEQQEHNRIRFWGEVEELEGRILRVITLSDGKTIHNAFPDRGFKR